MSVDLYDNVYGDFAGSAEGAVRRETYGVYLGQSSWMTAQEWLGFADLARVTASSDALAMPSDTLMTMLDQMPAAVGVPESWSVATEKVAHAA